MSDFSAEVKHRYGLTPSTRRKWIEILPDGAARELERADLSSIDGDPYSLISQP